MKWEIYRSLNTEILYLTHPDNAYKPGVFNQAHVGKMSDSIYYISITDGYQSLKSVYGLSSIKEAKEIAEKLLFSK